MSPTRARALCPLATAGVPSVALGASDGRIAGRVERVLAPRPSARLVVLASGLSTLGILAPPLRRPSHDLRPEVTPCRAWVAHYRRTIRRSSRAFESALVHQGLVVLVILALLSVAWNLLRREQLRRAVAAGGGQVAAFAGEPGVSEPTALRLLRISFGCIWVFDGILQAQVSMPLGMISGVVQPAAAGSPSWVLHLVNFGATIWNNHPVPAAASAVWIQLGIGIWLLVAPRGELAAARRRGERRLGAGRLGLRRGLRLIFVPGLTWLFGAPGGVVFYVIAGALIALPERYWARPRLGRVILASTGVFFVGMAVLQAWPGRGFWQGQPNPHAAAGSLTGMVQSMVQTPQPGFLSSWVASFAAFDAAHGWAVNLFVVIALTSIGVAFLIGRTRVVFWAVVAGALLCLADWVLIEDLGFLGGVGTDPNSMIPMLLIFVSGYVAITRLPAMASEPARRLTPSPDAASWWGRFSRGLPRRCASSPRSVPSRSFCWERLRWSPPRRTRLPTLFSPRRSTAPLGTQTSRPRRSNSSTRKEDPSAFGTCGAKSSRRHFSIPCAQRTVLSSLRSSPKPTRCWDSKHLGPSSSPSWRTRSIAPSRRHLLSREAKDSARSRTGCSSPDLAARSNATWNAYGVQVTVEPAGAMVAHNDIAYVIDQKGRVREILSADPGGGTAPMRSSFAGLVSDEMRHLLVASA